jgi:RNA polymerase sigma-70 factor (ECF subfamily)
MRVPFWLNGLHNEACDVATLPARFVGPPVIRAIGRRRTRPVGAPETPLGPPFDAAPQDPVLDDGVLKGAPLDDAVLVERSRVNAEAFGELYDRYCDKIYRFVYRRLDHREAAQDVTAEVFFKALKAIDSYRPATAPFSAWLYRIAANAVIDHLRATRATTNLDAVADTADGVAPVDEQAINRVEAARVWDAVESLGEAQRTAVTLRFGEDLPIARIAERMGRSEGAVKLLLNRGLGAVRSRLDATDVGQEQEDQP